MTNIDLILLLISFFVGLASIALYHIWSTLQEILFEIKYPDD